MKWRIKIFLYVNAYSCLLKKTWEARNETKVRIFVSTKTLKVMSTTSKRVHTEVAIARSGRNLVTQRKSIFSSGAWTVITTIITFHRFYFRGWNSLFAGRNWNAYSLAAERKKRHWKYKRSGSNSDIFSSCWISRFLCGEKTGDESDAEAVRKYRSEDVPSLKS